MQKFLKVLLADDEPNIREGIHATIDWNSVGLEVIGEAEDGEEALELALEHQIDILLVDLNMPIMDGLTLVRNIRKDLPECKVIIVTGYDEFSYAQEAIRLQVDDYVLKPVIPENLTSILRKMAESINIQRKENKYLEMASEHISKNTEVIQERFCQSWVEGSLPDEEIKEQLRFLNLPEEVPEGVVVFQGKELQPKQPLIRENEKDMFAATVKNIISEILSGFKHVMFSDQSGLIFIILWGEVDEGAFSKIKSSIKQYLHVDAAFSYESFNGGLTNLSEIYAKCKETIGKESPITPLVRRARSYIIENYTDPKLTLDTVAQTLQTSPVYLSRTIKQELGISFVSLITEMRMKKSIKLLNSTDLPVYEIAEQVGYDSQHYFSTVFKKAVGVSPNQYRKGITNIPT